MRLRSIEAKFVSADTGNSKGVQGLKFIGFGYVIGLLRTVSCMSGIVV